VTNVLMVTTTVGVLDGVHRDTTDARPRVPLGFVLVEAGTGLKHRLVDTATAGDDADHGAGDGRDDLLLAGWQADARLASVLVVCNDRRVVAGAAGDGAAVAGLGLQVADDGPLGHRAQGQDVADCEGSLLAAVQELAGGDALGTHERHALHFVAVRILELDLGERCPTSGIVDNLTDDPTNVAVLLSIVLVAELGRALAVGRLRDEDTAGTLPLTSDNAPHLANVPSL